MEFFRVIDQINNRLIESMNSFFEVSPFEIEQENKLLEKRKKD